VSYTDAARAIFFSMDDKVDDMEIVSGSDCVSVLIGAGDIVLMLLAIYTAVP